MSEQLQLPRSGPREQPIERSHLERAELRILTADEIAEALRKLEGHSLHTVVTIALDTGARRGEIAALRWSDLDLEAATLRIERCLEHAKTGVRVKPTKTAAGRRTVGLPAFTVDALREHRRWQLELRMALGLGALPQKSPPFGDFDGGWPNPYSFTDRWRDAVKSRKLPNPEEGDLP